MVRPAIVTSGNTITVRLIVWAILRRSGLSVTMRAGMEKMKAMGKTAAAMKKMNACVSSGWQSRSCVQPLVISMCRMKMRMTMARIRKPCRPCWQTGTRPMRIISIWNTVIICRKKLPGLAIYYMDYIMMTKR